MILLFLEMTCHLFSTGNFRKELAVGRGLTETQSLSGSSVYFHSFYFFLNQNNDL